MTESTGRQPIETLVIAPGNSPGNSLKNAVPKYLQEPTDAPSEVGFHNSKLATLTLLFLVTAALGIPMLWRNKRFNLIERMFWSAAVIAYTVGIIIILIWWLRVSMATIG